MLGPECASVIKRADHRLLGNLEQVVETDDQTALIRVRHCNLTYLIWKVVGIPSSFELKENFRTFENLHMLILQNKKLVVFMNRIFKTGIQNTRRSKGFRRIKADKELDKNNENTNCEVFLKVQ